MGSEGSVSRPSRVALESVGSSASLLTSVTAGMTFLALSSSEECSWLSSYSWSLSLSWTARGLLYIGNGEDAASRRTDGEVTDLEMERCLGRSEVEGEMRPVLFREASRASMGFLTTLVA